MAQLLGLLELYIGGAAIDIEPGGEVELGGVMNSEVVFGKKVGAAGKMMPSKISFTTVVQAGQRVTDTFGQSVTELQVHCDSGQIFSWDDAFRVGTLKFSGGEGGKLKLEYAAGIPVET